MTIANQVQASPGLYVNTPGQPVTNNIAIPQQVGMFPPNSNNQGGGSIAAALSGGGSSNGQPQVAPNMYITNEGVGNNITLSCALSTGTDGGNQSSPANGTEFGQATGGGAVSVGGAGGADMNANVGAVGDVALAAKAPAINLTFEGGSAAPHYAG
jgi:hypothetical protein